MALVTLVSNEEKIIQHKVIKKITEEEKAIAVSIFNVYRKKGVVLSEYSDNYWKVSDETNTIGLDFTVNQMLIKKYLKSFNLEEIIDLLKNYMCFCLGQYSLIVLRQIMANIKIAMEETHCFLAIPKRIEVLESTGVSDFIDILPFANEELIIECIDYTRYRRKRRKLAEYQSYFLFDKILDKFWEEASDYEKDLYYPILLWWKISMIIPLRVTEFTVIPKNCTHRVKKKWLLKIRRTELKGGGKIHGYKLDEDYKIYEYAVNDEIVSLIEDYKYRASKYKQAEIDSLFSDDMFITLLNTKGLEEMKHLKTTHLALLFDYFFTDIIEKKYSYKVLNKEDILKVEINGEQKKLNAYEIVKISLGDSRHIAMQNLLLNGCNILMAKEITGHESADMIFHYAGNIKNLIKCRAYSLFEMSKQKEVTISKVTRTNAPILLPNAQAPKIEVDAGICYSVPFATKYDTKDCFIVGGNCERCIYLKPEEGIMAIKKKQENIVEEKIARLNIWLNSTRKSKSKEEFRVLVNQLTANVENLQNRYIQDIKEGVKI